MPKKGFTLIELLVVISILSILSLIGFAAFRNVQGTARDSRRKSDIDEIAKAYEQRYAKDGTYSDVVGADFASGTIPTPPEGGNYFKVVANDGSSFKTCAALEGKSNFCHTDTDPSACFCNSSRQSAYSGNGGLSGNGSEIGFGLINTSCDPTNSLSQGLVAYWRMDESSWNGTSGEVKDSSENYYNGKAFTNGATTTTGKFVNAGNFRIGFNDYLDMGNPSGLQLTSSSFTISAWVKRGSTSTSTFPILVKGSIAAGVGTYELYLSNNKFSLKIKAADTLVFPVTITSTNSFTDTTKWYHVVGVYTADTSSPSNTASKLDLYVDGNLAFPQVTTAPYPLFSTTNVVRIGYMSAGGFYWKGLLDDVRIYNRALTPGEITKLYNGGFGCIPY